MYIKDTLGLLGRCPLLEAKYRKAIMHLGARKLVLYIEVFVLCPQYGVSFIGGSTVSGTKSM